jgi:hypothetical protein
MNAPVEIRSQSTDSGLGIIDCDIHPFPKAGALNAYLSDRWRKHLFEYGKFGCGPYADRGTYPRFQPNLSRRDAWPPSGGAPGSDGGTGVPRCSARRWESWANIEGVISSRRCAHWRGTPDVIDRVFV